MIRKLDTPIAPPLITLIAALLFVIVQMSYEGADAKRFIRLPETAITPGIMVLGGSPVVGPGGYDGQFYYRIALDPGTKERTVSTPATTSGITLDMPAYRQQRIVYPALAWALAGGDPLRIPLTLIVVNVLGLGLIAAIGAGLARSAGRHALWGMIFPLYPGFVVTLTRDLTEIVAATFLLGGLLLMRRAHAASGAASLLVAVFSRETTVIAGASAALMRFAIRPAALTRWVPFVVPVIALVAWQLLLTQRWGQPPVSEGAGSLDPPILGLLAAAWLNATRLDVGEAAKWIAVLGFAFISIAVMARALFRSVSEPHEKVAWAAYLALATVLEANIWANGAGVLRALTDLEMVGAILLLGSSGIGRTVFLGVEVALVAFLVVIRVAV